MSSLWKVISSIGAVLAAAVALFFYGKGKGKDEVKNEQMEEKLRNMEKSKSINDSVDNTDIDKLRDELHDPDCDK